MLALILMFRAVDADNESLPCKAASFFSSVWLPSSPSNEFLCTMSKIQVVGVSMDATNSIFDWLASHPDLKEFNVPLMSDR